MGKCLVSQAKTPEKTCGTSLNVLNRQIRRKLMATVPSYFWTSALQRDAIPLTRQLARTSTTSTAYYLHIQDGRIIMRDWLANTKTFWTTEANHKHVEELGDGPIRPYPYTYMTPITALSVEGESIVLHPRARRITVGCNLAVMLAKTGKHIQEEDVPSYVGSYRILAALKDWFWLDNKPRPTERDIWAWGTNYARWTDGFNCLSQASATPDELLNLYNSKMWIAVDGIGEITTNSANYLHTFADIVTYMSATITFRERDVLALGRTGQPLTIPADKRLPEGTMLRAEIEGIGKMQTPLIDRRELD
jgi:2-keto-4-pentenoate hydratase/2-oxohepta-3-ene-1,7-dioic acid hydratase in catechol pathway